MSGRGSSEGAGRRRRRRRRAERRQRRALAWWSRPGVLIFLAMVALAAVGWLFVLRDAARIPVEQATVDGLHLELLEARWLLDQMDHGENFQKPSTMMPDMPAWGRQRVTLELTLANRSAEQKIFDGSEFFLVPQIGDEVAPIGAQTGRARLAPGQSFNTAIYFDFDTTEPHGNLHVEWRRGEESVLLPVPEPAEHYHLRPRGGEIALPPDARLVMPLGKAERGERLYTGVYGCVACHGDPEAPGTNNVGPHLAGIAGVADGRVEGVPGAQYLYESILEPNAAIAPECARGRPCQEPSAMPEYAALVDLQDVADLLAYLISLDGGEGERVAEAP